MWIFRTLLIACCLIGSAAFAGQYNQSFKNRALAISIQAWGLPPGGVVLFGDSNTEIFRSSEVGGCQILNAGFAGARISDLAERASWLANLAKPSIVHVMVGTNNMRTPAGSDESDLRRIAKSFPNARVVLWAVPPIGPQFSTTFERDRINSLISHVAAECGALFVGDWAAGMIGDDGYAKAGWLVGDDVHLTMNGQSARAERIGKLDREQGAACAT
ncbi:MULTISPECIES: SGNH/GDSL hydrolase family protein [unclassified Sinorhizobium]|uniref:SGNH/GDSL hydrolase family protein n=1 Tax=unclassified Sinorhizobium TaxID=2613772 RepID=UPI003525AF66